MVEKNRKSSINWLRRGKQYDIARIMNTVSTDPVEALTALLESGRYPPRGRIPPERVLSEKLGITRAALRKALAVLESQNRIWRQVGRGTFVGARPAPNEDSAVTAVTSTTNPAEIMEARLVLEPKMASISALRATRNDLERMTHCLNRAEAASDFNMFEHWDGALHSAVAESTRNLLLITLFNTVNSLRQDNIWGRLKKAAMSGARQKIYSRQHREVVRAVENRDPAQAEKRMRIHLETVQKNLIKNI